MTNLLPFLFMIILSALSLHMIAMVKNIKILKFFYFFIYLKACRSDSECRDNLCCRATFCIPECHLPIFTYKFCERHDQCPENWFCLPNQFGPGVCTEKERWRMLTNSKKKNENILLIQPLNIEYLIIVLEVKTE